ncbi:hypothetical protein CSKR_104667 [Clonorchis sinensis]|uniref:Sema domain-containing protein n=1 Tax=Clonorchis sinensis TaxID=79923 RepID=A0A8T1M8C3_CLOSI|nr:hypothetical protein CSKR_104667 [Clonorchis sinensis]
MLLSAIELYPDVYEVCGLSGASVRCQLHLDKGGSWHWLQSMEVSYPNEHANVIFDYRDTHFIMAYSNAIDHSAVMQLRIAMPLFRILSMGSATATSMNQADPSAVNDHRWWSRYTETSNHRYMHFMPGARFRFHGFAVAPGKRYVFFSEVAKEVVNKVSWWSDEQTKVVYARVARICTGDPGFQMSNTGPNYFTSFFKARLICRVRGSRHSVSDSPPAYSQDAEFNHLVAVTQFYESSQSTSESTVYGLFSMIDSGSSPSTLRNVELIGPMALCAYRLSEMDRVFRTSDLIQILPRHPEPGPPVTASDHNGTNLTTTAESSHAFIPYWGSRSAFRRIRRIQDAGSATMTDVRVETSKTVNETSQII